MYGRGGGCALDPEEGAAASYDGGPRRCLGLRLLSERGDADLDLLRPILELSGSRLASSVSLLRGFCLDASSRDRSSCSRLSWPLKLLEPVASSEAAAPPRGSASVGIVLLLLLLLL